MGKVQHIPKCALHFLRNLEGALGNMPKLNRWVCFFLTYQAINYFIRYLVEINLLRNNYSGKCEAKKSATQDSR
jgi:hypothetical protein